MDFIKGEFYHVFNHSVDGRLFCDTRGDYEHFCESLCLYNDENYSRPDARLHGRLAALARAEFEKNRKPYVRVISYCLRPNHFHLLLQEVSDGGISKFMQKITMGHAKYKNIKKNRRGRLFDGTFRAVHVVSDAHFFHLPRYIHLNVLDDSAPDWRDGEIKDWTKAQACLDAFSWSSHHVYCGKPEGFPIVHLETVRQLFPDPRNYLDYLRDWSGRFGYPTADITSLSDVICQL
jgi:putative transposase